MDAVQWCLHWLPAWVLSTRGGTKFGGGGCLIILYAEKKPWGVFDLKQHWAEWSLCDIKVPRERYESIRIRLLFYHSRCTLMSCAQCTALLQVEHTYRLSAQHMANARGECWAHSELREPRGEHRQMLKRKPIFIQTNWRKLYIWVNW